MANSPPQLCLRLHRRAWPGSAWCLPLAGKVVGVTQHSSAVCPALLPWPPSGSSHCPTSSPPVVQSLLPPGLPPSLGLCCLQPVRPWSLPSGETPLIFLGETPLLLTMIRGSVPVARGSRVCPHAVPSSLLITTLGPLGPARTPIWPSSPAQPWSWWVPAGTTGSRQRDQSLVPAGVLPAAAEHLQTGDPPSST